MYLHRTTTCIFLPFSSFLAAGICDAMLKERLLGSRSENAL